MDIKNEITVAATLRDRECYAVFENGAEYRDFGLT